MKKITKKLAYHNVVLRGFFMNQEKLDGLCEKILSEVEKFNVTLKYGAGNQVALPVGNKPWITTDGWLILLSDDGKNHRYIDLGSVYEVVLNKD